MNRCHRLLATVLVVLATQACTKTGDSRPTPDASRGAPVQAVSTPNAAISDKQAALAHDLIPAVAGLPPDPGTSGTYHIGPHDLLKVEVFRVPELSSIERVDEDGSIVMPLIGNIQVGGLIPSEAEAVIAEILSRNLLRNPSVNVFVNEYASQDVTVSGSVKKPGVFPLKGRMTLIQAIAHAEGVDALANEEEVIIFRASDDGGTRAYVVNLELIQEGKLTDPVLIGDDRVLVPQSGSAVFLKGLSDTLRGFVRLPIY